MWMTLLLFCLAARAPHPAAANKLALLSGTLRTYTRVSCDDNAVTLRCPQGTTISVQRAQYESDDQCLCKNGQCVATSSPADSNALCVWPHALQYSLLQTVVEACQKKRNCKFHTSPKSYGGDPCPSSRKAVKVAYKCRPYEFRSKVACMNELVQIKCNPHSRIAVYSASFGRTEYESIQCPQPQGVPEETCLTSYATETVMQLCHGKRRCQLSSDTATFGDPCSENSRMYLKVVYTCVPRRVLKERYDEGQEEDEFSTPTSFVGDYDIDEGVDMDSVSPAPAAANPEQPQPTKSLFAPPPPPPLTPPSPPTNKHHLPKENEEKLYLYLIVSCGLGVVLLLLLVIARLLVQKRRATGGAKYNPNDSLPNEFAEEISEIDADISLAATTIPAIPPPPPAPAQSEVVRYGGGVRRHDSDTNPRSLSRPGNSQYYYG
ncbi:protein eva-1 isoform X4 [Neocloeon triangulifer]|uniref:protein eva-1 isoform X4 n=1 Tax=Neocloeon triangulifer TaxID=2078957 RepID=UPI00286F7BBC|nr:protein eva-1 isoform X4 [Neocloeon triangulifer]